MIRVVANRLAQSILVVWASVTLLFVIFFLLPGDRVDQVFGTDKAVSPEARNALTQKFALDEPAIEQYKTYWANVFEGDFGVSYVTGREVSDVALSAAPASLRLAFWALVVELVAGVATGAVVAVRRSKVLAGVSTVASVALLSAPIFVVGFVLQLSFGVYPFQNGWSESLRLPVQGIGPDSWTAGVIPVGGQWRHLLLPALTLGLASAVVAHRVMRESMRAAMQSSFVIAARARGVSPWNIFWRHGMRNAISPVLAFIAVDLATLFGAAVVTESVFNWPGVGLAMADALQRADVPVILGITIVLAIAYVVLNIAVDVVHGFVDPRTRRS